MRKMLEQADVCKNHTNHILQLLNHGRKTTTWSWAPSQFSILLSHSLFLQPVRKLLWKLHSTYVVFVDRTVFLDIECSMQQGRQKLAEWLQFLRFELNSDPVSSTKELCGKRKWKTRICRMEGVRLYLRLLKFPKEVWVLLGHLRSGEIMLL